ncbi:MAG TPA: hypothetical protein VGY77_12270, partial [Gemmataceae bacterium]|nr:hypothetical protein [Gemmataceae bacterium]
MEDRLAALDNAVPFAKMLGYLNFSDGKPDPRFQNQLNDAYQFLAGAGAGEPWTELHSLLAQKLEALHAGDSSAFRNIDQARAILTISLDQLLPAYRRHHGDLLFHLADGDLFGPFFLARVFEAVLVQAAPWSEHTRILAGALDQLNDFVGHRPIAILETRPKGEPYPHERIRPIPLFLRGPGVGYGRYQELIGPCLEILSKTDPEILAGACFDPKVLEELALDPRPFDQGHPANRRPNYVFGEWDPDHIDGQGRYTRLVVRQVVLDALLDRVHQESSFDRAELLGEAAGVLAGTILMAAGISGAGPTTHDSTTTLATLMPPIARYRDAFYANLLNGLPSPHGERLRQEAAMTRQPFGGARQHLNEFLARHRALQLQQRHLALIYAAMGFPESGRQEAAKIPSASVRMLGEILGRLATANLKADQGQLPSAASLLPEIEDLLQRGIACGALADPWNILGFQGLYPLFQSRDDSVRDTRIDDLIGIVEQILSLYTRLMSEAAASGNKSLMTQLTPALLRFAAWWDRFASVEVQDVRHVHGGEAVQSADHVAKALGRWHEQGEAAGDLAFWKRHLEGFRSPKAFALVVEALLRNKDYRASMALLVNWLNQVEQVPLEEGNHSFHALAIRWLLEVSADQARPDPAGPNQHWPLVKKFFDYLEANAGDFWTVPTWESANRSGEKADSEDEEELFSAAYENVTYRDTTDDDQEASVMDGGAVIGEFHLEAEADTLQKHLRFLGTIGQLWQIAARQPMHPDEKDSPKKEIFQPWLATARKNLRRLLDFVDAVHEYPIPEPLGSHDSMVEYDRRRSQKEQILYAAIGTCLETYLAAAAFQGALKQAIIAPEDKDLPGWEIQAIRLEGALWQGNRQAVQTLLPSFLERFRSEPLL